MSYDNIPRKMREYDQWINWQYENLTDDSGSVKVVKLPLRPLDGKLASVAQPRDWVSFEVAYAAAEKYNCGMGFVFSKSDPFTGIDLDNKHGAHTDEWFTSAFDHFQSYAELSPSGQGAHIITEAKLSHLGTRKGDIEIYDNFRFFTMTGNRVSNFDIVDCQDKVTALYDSIRPEIVIADIAGLGPEHYTDQQVIEHARSASNGAKFTRLFNGDWQTDYGNQSQSEGDFALINIIAFYSRNASQTLRVFRQSVLGQRVKASRSNYSNRMVQRAFDRMPKQVTVNGAEWFNAGEVEPWVGKFDAKSLGPFHATEWKTVKVTPITPIVAIPLSPFQFADPIPPMQIPGIVGKLVEHTWNSAFHQIAEASIVSALSTMSLLCSRSYRHGSMGLSLYLLLLAQTSTGKSFGYSANDARFNAMINKYRSILPPHSLHGKKRAELLERMVMGEMGSAQGLSDQIIDAPATLAHLDEYVDNIRQMAQPNPSPHLAAIRSELLRLMEMSGPGRIYRARKLSKRGTLKGAEVVDVLSASLTIFATGTPEQFYDELSNTLLTSGFLPRFTILEYTGELTKPNKNANQAIDPQLLENLCFLFDKSVNISGTLTGELTEFVDVQPVSEKASEALDWFDHVCLNEVQQANHSGTNMAGIWSRAKDHVRQIACLIAIGCNPHVPKIEIEHINIAIAIVKPVIEKIQRKVTAGEVGTGDDRREAEIRDVLVKFMERGYIHYRKNVGIRRELFENGYFQLSMIRNQCTRLAVFKNHRMGASRAFEDALLGMVRYGLINVVDCNGVKCATINVANF